MKKVLVTGAAGFIGSHLVRKCLAGGDAVIGVDSLTSYYSPAAKRSNVAELASHPDWRFVEADVRSGDVDGLVAQADVVVHLAAQPGVRASWGHGFDAYVDSNITALQRVLEAAMAADVSRVVFASSSSVYGNAAVLPAAETAPLHPLSPYGATKVFGENMCRLYHANFGLPVVLLRYFTVYGPRQRPDMAFHKLISAALTGGEIVINGDGEQTRDFTYVADAVDATYAAVSAGAPGAAYNVGGGHRVSMNEVLAMLADLAGAELRVRHVEPQRGDARDTSADTTRAREDLSFNPSMSLEDGLRAHIDAVRSAMDTTSLLDAAVHPESPHHIRDAAR
jgi:nucleoside-diphosphate-sugar epimerase